MAQRNVPPTEVYPGMYGPGQTHRDAPASRREQLVWRLVIAGLLIGGLALFALAALAD